MHNASIHDLKTALDAGDAVVIDVREAYEFDDGHVPGAVHISMATVPVRASEFPTHSPAYVICQSGGRSWQVCTFLERQGIEAINVDGGTEAWQASGWPIEVGSSTH